MPTRDHQYAAVVTEKLTGSADYVITAKTLGEKQSISALNNAGMYVPGILRLNPVVIDKRLGVGTPATNTPTVKYGATPFVVRGDIAAWLAGTMYLDNNLTFWSQWDSTMASYSLAKANAKMSEPDFDAGMILVELDETIHGLRHPLDALRKYIQNFNKMRSRGPKVSMTDTLDMLSGSWLEWRYGITPLIIAIESAIKHFQQGSSMLQGKLLRKRGKVAKIVPTAPYALSSAPGYCYFSGQANIEVVKSTVSTNYFQFTSPITFAERYGLNALNIPALVWERIPLSFVLDWFLGVGLWLQSVNLSDKRTTIGSCTSQKTTVTIRIPDVKVSVGANSYSCGSSYVLTYEKLERRTNLAPLLLPVVNPAFLTLQRRLDAATLIWQRLPKFRR